MLQNDECIDELSYLNQKKKNLIKPTLELFSLNNQKSFTNLFNEFVTIDNEREKKYTYIQNNKNNITIPILKEFLDILRQQSILQDKIKQKLIVGYRMAY
jgi:hypothetical protein